MIKVYKNDLEKIYTVFFADTVKRNIKVGVRDAEDKEILIEEEFEEKGLQKQYSLNRLSNGPYEIFIAYDDTVHVTPIHLKSRKKILEEAITLQPDYPTLNINVTQYNMDPMNIFIYTMEDRLLKMYYWEPHENITTKKINLESFEGYEVRVQIVQDGEDKLEQLVPLY